ncbi:MAG: polysaccharide deacetylase family protein [Bacteroidales bacterium]|jgi:peptidoglycan/xylan/chitin deacetylase (PgdA/CDA1 family)|nr:polysaccharide deacetylase family protein [Bacteroidales bacterium]
MLNNSIRGLLLALAVFCFHTSNGQEQEGACITTWYHDKPGAVSISFDDGGYTQYTEAYPVLEKYSLKATFGIVGEWVREEPSMSAEPNYFEIRKMGWKQLLELYDHGHELAAHGYRHERYNKFDPVDTLARHMVQIKLLIESRIHQPVLTIHYPYSFASGNIHEAALRAGFLFGRTGLDTVNSGTPRDMHLLATHSILNAHEPDSTTFLRWLDQAEGNWLILMYHNLFSENSREMSLIHGHNVEYSYSLPKESFEMQVRETIYRDYWIAPISTVGKYIMERDNTQLRFIRCKDKIILVASTNLDTRIFNQPLTLEVNIRWRKVKVTDGLQDKICETKNNKLLIDINPESVIIISKTK